MTSGRHRAHGRETLRLVGNPVLEACALVIGATLSAGCDDVSLAPARGALEADPAALDFEEHAVGTRGDRVLRLLSVGAGPVEVQAARVEPPTAPFVTEPPPPGRLPPGSSAELSVGFVPKTPGRMESAELLLMTAEPGVEVRVPLTGVAGIRRIAARPPRIDFGVVNEGTASVRTLEVQNIGGSPLTLQAITWTSTSLDLGPASGTLGTRGLLPPGASVQLELQYAPLDLGPDLGMLRIESDDPEQGRLDIPVVGRANLRPVASLYGCRTPGPGGFGCSPSRRSTVVRAGLDDVVYLDGRDLLDPEGAPLELVWSVPIRPAGSIAAVFPGDGMPTGDLLVDRLGRYEVTLTALDDRGLSSDPARVAITPRDLVVVLRWDVATDVDLHLVRPGGRVGDYGSGAAGSLGSDCSTFNRAPNWGDEADADDDPRLERDAVSTPGPEVIGLDRPEPGAYRVYAHYCDGQNVRVDASVQIEISSRGVLVERVGAVRLRPGELWPGAILRWDPSTESPEVEALEDPITWRPEICRPG